MNNYFGIGIDAKISLDFHNKREAAAGFAHKHWMVLSTFIAILLPPNMRMGSTVSYSRTKCPEFLCSVLCSKIRTALG